MTRSSITSSVPSSCSRGCRPTTGSPPRESFPRAPRPTRPTSSRAPSRSTTGTRSTLAARRRASSTRCGTTTSRKGPSPAASTSRSRSSAPRARVLRASTRSTSRSSSMSFMADPGLCARRTGIKYVPKDGALAGGSSPSGNYTSAFLNGASIVSLKTLCTASCTACADAALPLASPCLVPTVLVDLLKSPSTVSAPPIVQSSTTRRRTAASSLLATGTRAFRPSRSTNPRSHAHAELSLRP